VKAVNAPAELSHNHPQARRSNRSDAVRRATVARGGAVAKQARAKEAAVRGGGEGVKVAQVARPLQGVVVAADAAAAADVRPQEQATTLSSLAPTAERFADPTLLST
jgi:hypothetical protein